jgi:hypothetical protein
VSAGRATGLVLVAIAVGVAAGVILLRGGGGGEPEPDLLALLRRDTISAHPTMEPRTHLFYERVTAGLDLVFDRRIVREGTIRVTTGFEPYKAGSPSVERTESGDLVRLRYRWDLECVTADCLPQSGSSTRFDFSLGRLDFVIIDQGRSAQPVEWPSIEATSRVGPLDVEQAQWRALTARPPEVSYRMSPGVLGAGLLGGAVLLLTAAGALAWQFVPSRVREDVVETEAARRVSAIERALELALASSANGGSPEQRRALERLARELGTEGLGPLTERARRLAWAPALPSRVEVERLADDVRRQTGVSE